MTSVLNVDEIAAKNGTDPVTLTKQSATKVWGNFTNSTFAVNDSFNTSSITDSGTGAAEPNYTNNMANDDYSATSSAEKSASYHAIFHAAGTNPTTAKNGVNTASALNTAVDAEFVSYQICGDLA